MITTTKGLDGFADFVKEKIGGELEAQGHRVGPGDWLGSDIDHIVKQGQDTLTLQFMMRGYAEFVDRGVSADRIPFSGITGRGGTSKYISALEQWAARRGMDNPLGAAFAIAHTHRKEGMPTQGSRQFSATGKRTDFLNEMGRRNGNEISDRLFLLFSEYIETQMDNIFENERKLLNQS